MIPGITAVSDLPVAALPAALDASTPDPLPALLAALAGASTLVHVLVARPYDPAMVMTVPGPPAPVSVLAVADGPSFTTTGAVVTVRLSSHGFRTGLADDRGMGAHEYAAARLESPLNRQARIPVESGSAANQAFGEITVLNDAAVGGAGALDPLLDLGWDGREIEVLAGAGDWALADFLTAFRGTAAGLTWDEGRLGIRLRDHRERFSVDLPTVFYAGTGGAEGGADLANAPKPIALGTVINARPVLVDAANLVYQAGDDLRSIAEVRDKGVALTAAGDVADIFATTVAAGEFKTELGRGLLRLGASPAGTVTVDVTGPAAAGDTTGRIVRHIATTRMGATSLRDATEIEAGSFGDLDTAQPAPVGFYIDASRPAAGLIDELMDGIGGWWTFRRDGRMVVGRLAEPADPVAVLTEADITGIEALAMEPPTWRQRVDHTRNWTVQRDDDLAGSVSAADREFYGQQFRTASAVNRNILIRHRLARDATRPGTFAAQADADAETSRRLALFGVERAAYRVGLARGLYQYELGQTVTIDTPRFGLAGGRDFVITGLVEDAVSEAVELEVWG